MEDKKLLLLGGSPGSKEIIQYAQSQGIYTIVTDWLALEQSEIKQLADEYWMISFSDLDILEKRCKDAGINAVIAASSDYAIDTMIELCRRLHLPCYCTKDSYHYSRDKSDFKKVCKSAGILVPEDYVLSENLTEEDLDRVEFPVVVKPVDQTNSRGISFCNNKDELIHAYQKAKDISDSKKIIVEKKIEGKEYAAYYALADGEASLLFLHSVIAPDEDSVGKSFATSNVTLCVEEFVSKINDKVITALKSMGCRENIAWVQVILSEAGDFYAIEMAHRLGADIIPIEYCRIGALDLVQWGVECALGKKHTREDLPKGLEHPMDKYIYSSMLCCGTSGIVKEIKGIVELGDAGIDVHINVNVGEEVKCGEKVMGCVGFCADSIESLCEKINLANRVLQIKNGYGENMVLIYMTPEQFMLKEFG